jgi:hypothetical protein
MLLIPPLRRRFYKMANIHVLPHRPADDSNYSQVHRYRDRVNAIGGAQLPGCYTQPILRNGMMDVQPLSYFIRAKPIGV